MRHRRFGDMNFVCVKFVPELNQPSLQSEVLRLGWNYGKRCKQLIQNNNEISSFESYCVGPGFQSLIRHQRFQELGFVPSSLRFELVSNLCSSALTQSLPDAWRNWPARDEHIGEPLNRTSRRPSLVDRREASRFAHANLPTYAAGHASENSGSLHERVPDATPSCSPTRAVFLGR
jgi:hypothetical protein